MKGSNVCLKYSMQRFDSQSTLRRIPIFLFLRTCLGWWCLKRTPIPGWWNRGVCLFPIQLLVGTVSFLQKNLGYSHPCLPQWWHGHSNAGGVAWAEQTVTFRWHKKYVLKKGLNRESNFLAYLQARPCCSERVSHYSSTATNGAVLVSEHVNIISHFSLLILLKDDLIELIFWMKSPKARPLNTFKSTDTLYSTLIPGPSILTFSRLSVNAQKTPSDHFSFSLILNPIILRAWNLFGFVSWRSIPSRFLPAVPPRQRPRFGSTWSASSQQDNKKTHGRTERTRGELHYFYSRILIDKVSCCLYECKV